MLTNREITVARYFFLFRRKFLLASTPDIPNSWYRKPGVRSFLFGT